MPRFASPHFFAFLVLCLFNAFAHAASNIPIEDFFRNEQYGSMHVSPDGKYLAVTTSIKDKFGLAVVDLEMREVQPVAAFYSDDVTSFFWSSNNRLVACCGYQDGQAAVNWDGTKDMIEKRRAILSIHAKYNQ